MLELRIGSFEDNKELQEMDCGIWRFVLAKKDESIMLYAAAVPMDASCFHRDVVRKYEISHCDVLGGGNIRYGWGKMDINDMSKDFGIVPNQIIEEFAKMIPQELKSKSPLKKITVDMWYDQGVSERKNSKHIEMWKGLGYDFDNQKRVLEF